MAMFLKTKREKCIEMKKVMLFLIFTAIVFSACGRKYSYKRPGMAKEMITQDYRRTGQSIRYKKKSYYPQNRKRYYKNQKKVYYRKNQNQQPQVQESKRIYSANISLEVRSPKESKKKINQIIEKNKGFLQSETLNKIVIRVPSKKFDYVVSLIVKLGIVLSKKITSYDVTDQYADLERRLEIANKAKKRLLILLKKVKKVRERVRIIEEIERITRQIETYKKILSALASFVEYSLIEIYLRAPNRRSLDTKLTPFTWINRLTPERYTLKHVDDNDVEIKLPADFILFEKEDFYLTRSPKGSYFRAGKIENNPKGDQKFWKKAMDYAMKLKNYIKKKEGTKGTFEYSLYRYRTLKPFYYLIALSVTEKNILIFEGFFPSKKESETYVQSIIENLSNAKIKE